MQSAAVLTTTKFRFDEPIRLLLDGKGTDVWSVAPEATVYDAIEAMSQRQIGALVVIAEDHLKGIVSERDYARKVILKGRSSHDTLVREIMTTEVYFVTADRTIGECMHLMTTRRVRHLPVLEGTRVIGMVSIGDLVNWVISSHEQTINHLQNYIAGRYPA